FGRQRDCQSADICCNFNTVRGLSNNANRNARTIHPGKKARVLLPLVIQRRQVDTAISVQLRPQACDLAAALGANVRRRSCMGEFGF
ncbi:MAG TPA: hypothetical protein VH278_06450, partial [Burkholderiaceae bacterium]|nr:hypothetical protein [Burkholderiaceae bacterium]